jgi:hypothetical protein
MIKDLKIFKWQRGPQRGQESLYSFRLAGDVTTLFTQLMQAPKYLRYYYREEWRWEVVPVPFIIDLLRRGTKNLDEEYHRARKTSEDG